MDLWTDIIAPALQEMACKDLAYQMLFQYRAEKQKFYEQIMEKLSPEEYELVEDYIASCEDLEYRLTQLAFELGRAL